MTDIIQKTRDDYNLIAPQFAKTRQGPWPEFEYFKKFIKDNQTVLDWGCGNGRLLNLIKSYKGMKYFGVDISGELIKIARKNFKDEIKEGWVKFHCISEKQKKFKENFFDLVFMMASFHHLPDEESRLKTLERVFTELKPDGRIIMTVWNLESEWAKNKLKEDWEKAGESDVLVPWKDKDGNIICMRYYHSFSKKELKKLLREAGFKVEKLDYFGDDKKKSRNILVVAKKEL